MTASGREWVRVLKKVGQDPAMSPADKSVYLSVTSYANYVTEECFPSMAKIAKDTKLSKRTVRRSIDRLVAAGYLEIVKPGGPRRATIYRVPTKSYGAPRGTVTTAVPEENFTVPSGPTYGAPRGYRNRRRKGDSLRLRSG